MPHLYQLNPPVNPFWDFVAGLEDHPFFNGPPHHRHESHPPFPGGRPEPAWASARNQHHSQPQQPEMSEKAQGKQPSVEDPPEVDPSTVKPEQKCHQGRFPTRHKERMAQAESEEPNGCHRNRREGCHGPRAHRGRYGPPPFMMGNPFFARPPWMQGPPEGGPRGPPFPHHHPFGPPPHARGPHRRPSPPHHPRPGFDLGEFLNSLGNKLGVDLSGAAEGLGLTADRFTAGRTNQDVNFEPRTDIFENKEYYTIHLSLPGAKKYDIGVDYDGEHSVLRVTGVVHRPEVDEKMLAELVVDGRKRETGVFEKAIRLGTKREPANIDVAGINAKMTDGVLVIRVPKVETVSTKREVPINADPVAAGQANYEDEYSEKPVLFDAEDHVSVVDSEAASGLTNGEINLMDAQESESPKDKRSALPSASQSKKEEEYKETLETAPAVLAEQLPAYAAEEEHGDEDWENFSDASAEADYVKINVN